MIILIAPTSFNDDLNALEAADAMAKGWQKANPKDTIITLPITDNEAIDTAEFTAALKKSDILLTGNGELNTPVANEKIVDKIAERAKKASKQVIAFAIKIPAEPEVLFDAVFSIVNQPMSLKQAIEQTSILLENSVYQVASLYKNIGQSSIEVIQPKASIVQKWIFLNADLVINEIEVFRLILEKAVETDGLIILYGAYSKQTYEAFFEEIGLSCPFITEYGGGIYIPKSATTIYFDGMEQNDQYFYQHLGISTAMIQGIVDKLAKISSVKLEIIQDIQPTQFSTIYQLKKPNTNLTLFQNLLRQQGLDCIQNGAELWIGQQKLSVATEKLLTFIAQSTTSTTYSIGVKAVDKPILEQVDEPYLIKQSGGWLPLQLPMLNMINQEGIKGVELVFEEILKEK